MYFNGDLSMKFKDKLKATWYFRSTIEKIIIIVATLSLFYSGLRILTQGVW